MFLITAMISLTPVFAINPNDSAPTLSKNYTKTNVKIIHCPGSLGGDSDKDGICDSW